MHSDSEVKTPDLKERLNALGLTAQNLRQLTEWRQEYPGMPSVLDCLEQAKTKYTTIQFQYGQFRAMLPSSVIEWEGDSHNFGQFEVVVPLTAWENYAEYGIEDSELADVLTLISQDNDGDENPHPHIEFQKPCLGEAYSPLRLALRQMRFEDALDICQAMLCTYNPESPYQTINFWLGGGQSCSECGENVNDYYFGEMCSYCFNNSSETFTCELCDENGWSDDSHTVKNTTLCSSCVQSECGTCIACEELYIHDNGSEVQGELICAECAANAEKCGWCQSKYWHGNEGYCSEECLEAAEAEEKESDDENTGNAKPARSCGADEGGTDKEATSIRNAVRQALEEAGVRGSQRSRLLTLAG